MFERPWLKRAGAAIALFSAVITIFVFVTGYQSLGAVARSVSAEGPRASAPDADAPVPRANPFMPQAAKQLPSIPLEPVSPAAGRLRVGSVVVVLQRCHHTTSADTLAPSYTDDILCRFSLRNEGSSTISLHLGYSESALSLVENSALREHLDDSRVSAACDVAVANKVNAPFPLQPGAEVTAVVHCYQLRSDAGEAKFVRLGFEDTSDVKPAAGYLEFVDVPVGI